MGFVANIGDLDRRMGREALESNAQREREKRHLSVKVERKKKRERRRGGSRLTSFRVQNSTKFVKQNHKLLLVSLVWCMKLYFFVKLVKPVPRRT